MEIYSRQEEVEFLVQLLLNCVSMALLLRQHKICCLTQYNVHFQQVLTFSDHANNATTTIIHSRLDDSLETGDPFCQKHKFSDPSSRCTAFSFLFPFFLHPPAAQEEYKTANVTLTREMLTTQGLLLHWVCAMGIL